MPSAASIKLCSLTVAKQQLKAESTAENDTLIDRYVSIASLWIEGQCGREFKQQPYSAQIYDGSGEDLLYTRHAPISVVASIEYRAGQTWTAEVFTANDLSLYDKDEQGRIRWIDGRAWPCGDDNVRLTYTAGYDPIPYDLQHACAELVQALWHRRENMTHLLPQIQTVDGVTTIFRDQPIPTTVQRVIEKYRLFL